MSTALNGNTALALRLESVTCDIVLRILDEEPVGEAACQLHETLGENSETLTSTTMQWEPQYPDAKDCAHQSIHATAGSRVARDSWPR